MENRSLILDFVEWIAKEPRRYDDVMDAWRTSCPRLSIWEDATSHQFVKRELGPGNEPMVRVTEAGLKLLRTSDRPTPN